METATSATLTPTVTATSSNYFTVAQGDDEDAVRQQQSVGANGASAGAGGSGSGTPTPEVGTLEYAAASLGLDSDSDASDEEDEATGRDSRQQRIAAAVERSKMEYKAEHAYTERGWFMSDEAGRKSLSKPKADRQHLEYLATSLYYASPPDPRGALEAIISALDPRAKTLGGLTRELIDIGLRAALECNDMDAGLKLVECGKSLWKGQFAGHSALSADIYLKAGRPRDALTPLLMTLYSFGLHQPVLLRLAQAFRDLMSSSDSDPPSSSETTAIYPMTEQFLQIIDRAIEWRGSFLSKRLFAEPTPVSGSQQVSPSRPSSHPDQTGSTDQPPHSTTTPSVTTTASASASGSGSGATHFDNLTISEPIDIPTLVSELKLNQVQRQALEGTWNRLCKGVKSDLDAEGGEEEGKSVRQL